MPLCVSDERRNRISCQSSSAGTDDGWRSTTQMVCSRIVCTRACPWLSREPGRFPSSDMRCNMPAAQRNAS